VKKNKCPVCGHFTYEKHAGKYEGYIKVTSKWGRCSICGFFYEQHIKHSLEEQAKKYKKLYIDRR